MTDTTKTITRRQFWAALRKLGYRKAGLQMTRTALTYENEKFDADSKEPHITVTLPKHHEEVVWIMGDTPFSGMWTKQEKRLMSQLIPDEWDLLSTIVAMCSGDVEIHRHPETHH